MTTEWKDFSINVSGIDLKRIASGFRWVSNEPENRGKIQIVFYLDEIYYQFDTDRKEPLFLRSHEPVALERPEAFINNFAYIYDNALAVLTLTYGEQYDKVQQIADSIVYAANNDHYYDAGMLRNVYVNGSISSFPGWFSPRGKDFDMLPGYQNTDIKVWKEYHYAVSINTGNIAWAIISLLEMYRTLLSQTHLTIDKNSTYLATAKNSETISLITSNHLIYKEAGIQLVSKVGNQT
ncbi:hypothetical protein FACS1894181_02420 [Bacteroidia bacterium]|nr:hypothetical protein FACS1894181_02420 [Bacteroidia bacterium]